MLFTRESNKRQKRLREEKENVFVGEKDRWIMRLKPTENKCNCSQSFSCTILGFGFSMSN